MIAKRIPRPDIRKNQQGFSLIELLVVITIIGVLAGMLFAAWPAMKASMKKKQTITFMKELEAGLDNYKIDNSIYPLNPETPSGISTNIMARDTVGINGSLVLYKHLSGDFDTDPEGLVDPDEKVYVERLAFYYSDGEGALERAFKFRDGFAVVDPFGNPVRYIANPPNDARGIPIKASDRDTLNPTYDLWSIADGEGNKGTPEDVSRWITNWKDL